MGYETAYEDNHTPFKIEGIVWEQDYITPEGVQEAREEAEQEEEFIETYENRASSSDEFENAQQAYEEDFIEPKKEDKRNQLIKEERRNPAIIDGIESGDLPDKDVSEISSDKINQYLEDNDYPEGVKIDADKQDKKEVVTDILIEKRDLTFTEEARAEDEGLDVSTGYSEQLSTYKNMQNNAASRAAELEDKDSKIEFRYEAPSVSVDMSARFVTHEIIGGSTVRQKIGEDPLEVSADGVCTESKARRLDELRNAKYATISSNRLPDGNLDVQFASISTQPMEKGGAVALTDDDGEFLYGFSISMVEVKVPESEDNSEE